MGNRTRLTEENKYDGTRRTSFEYDDLYRLTNVEYGDGKVMVTYYIFEPGGDCLNVATDVSPYEVAEVRRMDAPVTFSHIREYVFCKPNL